MVETVLEGQTIRIDKAGDGITWLVMNRPEKRNAISPTMNREMLGALDELEYDDDTQVVVLTGEGVAFSAGMDLREYFRDLDGNPKAVGEERRRSTDWRLSRLSNFEKVTIAMVNGWCCGGGFVPVYACDFAIAAEEARFSLSEVNWGIMPGPVTKVFRDWVGYRDALYYILTAEEFDGGRAASMRLVNYAVPGERLREETVALARRLMEKNPHTLSAAKRAVRTVGSMTFEQAEEYLQAKSDQLRRKDPERGRERGMSEFLDAKSYKPGLSAYPR